MKNWKTKMGGVLLVLLAVLLFFSKTIYASRLPKITGEMPKKGTLKNSYHGTGVVEWGKKQWVYLPVGGKVSEISLDKGDWVTEKQPLITMEYDRDEANSGLTSKQQEQRRLALSKESLLLDIDKAKRELAFLETPEGEEEEESYQLELLDVDIKEAVNRLREVRKENEGGEATDSQVDSARYALQKLYLQKDQLLVELESKEKKAEKKLAKDEKSYEKDKGDKKDQLTALEIQLSQLLIEQESAQLDTQPFNKTLNRYKDNESITSPADGRIIQVLVEPGESVQEGHKLIELGVSGGLVVKASAPLENDFIKEGDRATLYNANMRAEGKITNIEVKEQEKLLTIALDNQDISPGETLTVELEKTSTTTFTLVPNNAVRKDKDGYFLNVIQQRDGLMGDEYYLSRLSIEVGDSDSTHTAVVKGINFYEPIAVRSTQNIETGQVVNLENKEEFYSES